MEVVIVIQPDDWLDITDCGSRVFGVWKSRLAAEAAVRETVQAAAKTALDESATQEEREDWEDTECERFAYEVCDVND
jgi:hypothetical protein